MTRSQIVYMELKYADPRECPSHDPVPTIGRVTFSKTGKTLYYKKKEFLTLSGGYKANYLDESYCEWWISGCKRDGSDSLTPTIVHIDPDVRVEYWTSIRNRPDCISKSSFRSKGHTRRGHPSNPRRRTGRLLNHSRAARRFIIDRRWRKARLMGLE